MLPKYRLITVAVLVAVGLAVVAIIKSPAFFGPATIPMNAVQVFSEPGNAELYVDGERKGNTHADKAMPTTISLTMGKHTVEARLPIEPVRWIDIQNVEVTDGAVQSVTLTLKEDEGARKAYEEAQAQKLAAAQRARVQWQSDPQGATLTLDGVVTQRFVWIKPGTFLMGSPSSEPRRGMAENQHQVTLTTGYYLADTECTQALWRAIMGKNPSRFTSDDNLPVERVSWEAIQPFLRQLTACLPLGMAVRLPTEAEWEYACRAGTTTTFSFGPTIDCEHANYNGFPADVGITGVNRQKTIPVKSLPANAWGIFGMHGNVFEWCSDWDGDYPAQAVSDPVGPKSGTARVKRGGSWRYAADSCRSASRGGWSPSSRYDYLGFRIVVQSTQH